MNPDELRERTKTFAKRIVRLCRELPRTQVAKLIGNQVFRSGTSIGANYRAACRGRSRPDFISKPGIVLEETDETLYWLEILAETEVVSAEMLAPLARECRELPAIFVASLNTAKR
ncbi:MAG: four helix bundle protein [Gemmataceae bacterium]|nr:four helix bundle protein [Gemmataceae bacterium]